MCESELRGDAICRAVKGSRQQQIVHLNAPIGCHKFVLHVGIPQAEPNQIIHQVLVEDDKLACKEPEQGGAIACKRLL